jgi:hypothetical protein
MMFKRVLLFICVVVALMTTVFSVSAAPPTKPVISSPEDGIISHTHTPLLVWEASEGATSYQLILRQSDGTPILTTTLSVADDDPCTGNTCLYSMVGDGISLQNRLYKWRVVAINDDGSNASPFAEFKVDYPGKPGLTLPQANQNVSPTPAFQWELIVQADYYFVFVQSLKTGFTLKSVPIDAVDACSSSCAFAFNVMLPKGDYRWWVEARTLTFPNVSRSAKRKFTVVVLKKLD